MNNHIFLVLNYIAELKRLARMARWVELTRKQHEGNERIILALDDELRRLVLTKIQIQDEMFEIMRSN